MTKSQARHSCKTQLRKIRQTHPTHTLPPIPISKILSHVPQGVIKILLYVATPLEPKTHKLIDHLLTHTSHQIFIPNTSQLSPAFTQLTLDTPLFQTSIRTQEEPNPLKLFHATDFTPASICLVPCLGVNLSNYRLGYGSGFYDRFLSDFPGTTIGIVHNKNIVDFTPEAHDIPLDTILTW
jgi:5-formyltetrahydrofolate cyclo-ligase